MLTLLFRLPFMPVRGVIRLAELIGDEAERELHDPARVRRQLEEAEQEWLAGNISEEELSQAVEEATSLLGVPEQPATNMPPASRAPVDRTTATGVDPDG